MRKPMVTRTVIGTKVTFLALDLVKCEPSTETLTIAGVYKDEKKLFAKVQEAFDNEQHKAVHITTSEKVEACYGMDEQKFIENAIVLDPKTRKALEEAEAVTDAEAVTEE